MSLWRTSRRNPSAMTAMVGLPIFMTNFRAEMKAFDMKRVVEDRTLTGSVDMLILAVGEIVGWSMQIDDCDELIGAQRRTSSTRRRLWLHGPAQVCARTGA